MNNNHNYIFRDYVTSTAFNLSLTKNMIAFLVWVAAENNPDNNEKSARTQSNSKPREIFIATTGRYDPVGAGRALERRGLIWSPYPKWPGIFCLTDAGRHVFELLKIAGLIEKLNLNEMFELENAK